MYVEITTMRIKAAIFIEINLELISSLDESSPNPTPNSLSVSGVRISETMNLKITIFMYVLWASVGYFFYIKMTKANPEKTTPIPEK